MFWILGQGGSQTLVVPVGLLVALLAPLYGLVGGLYVLLFRHSNNEDRHINRRMCDESRENLRHYIRDVDTRAGKAVESLKDDMNQKFSQLFSMLKK